MTFVIVANLDDLDVGDTLVCASHASRYDLTTG